MRMRSALALAVLAGVAPLTIGQVERPKFYVWNQGGVPFTQVGSNRDYVKTPDLKAMIKDYNVQSLPNNVLAWDPKVTARLVAREVIFRTTSATPEIHLEDEEVVISFFTFGRDERGLNYRLDENGYRLRDSEGNLLPPIGGMDCDSLAARTFSGLYDPGEPEDGSEDVPTEHAGAFWESPLRFFRDEDRLPTPGYEDGTPEAAFNFPASDDRIFARTYRNPVMLKNADPDPNNFPPLKKWMDEFCKEYVKIHDDVNHAARAPLSVVYNPQDALDFRGSQFPLPNPKRMHLDNETHDGIAWVLHVSDLYMLSRLAASKDYVGAELDYNYWDNPAHKVPGTGKTLDELYQAKRQELALRTPPVLWPADIRNLTTGLDLDFASGATPESDRNRPFMLWYADVCRQARNAVMENCFYGVVKNYWNGECKTSNYDDGKTDGVIDKTGWFMDSLGTKNDLAPNDEIFPLRAPSNQLPRGWGMAVGKLARYWDEVSGTWDVHRTFCSADMSSPVTYKIDPYTHAGNGGYGGGVGGIAGERAHVECAQQPNLYMRLPTSDGGAALVNETADETTLRLVRHRLESCQASNNRVHEHEIVPWVAMAHEERQSPKYARDLMAMLRSHKVSEIIVFSGRNVDIDHPTQRGAAVKNWKDTQPLIDQVYSPYVWSYNRVLGTLPTGESTSQTPEKLEFVASGAAVAPETVNVVSETLMYDSTNVVMGSTLEVEIRGFYDAEKEKGYFSTFQPNSVESGIAYGYTLYLECAAKPISGDSNGFYGQVEVFDWNSGTWKLVRICDSVQDESHQDLPPRIDFSQGAVYFLPVAEGGGVKSTRIAIDIRSSQDGETLPQYNFVSTGTMYSHNGGPMFEVARGTMRLRLSHFNNNRNATFESKYDLVQVVPFPFYRQIVVGGQVHGEPGAITFGSEEGDLVPGRGGVGQVLRNIQTEYTFGPVDLETFPHAPEYYSNPIVEKFDLEAAWEPAQLDDVTCSPVHLYGWNATNETGTNWPAGYDTTEEIIPNTRLVNSLFSLSTASVTLPNSKVVAKQKATARFTSPIWTNAPEETSTNLVTQPYTVWFWLTPTMQWADVTAAMNVEISRDPSDLNREVVVSSRATTPMQAGFYALVLNITPPAVIDEPNPEEGERYAVFCGGTFTEPGPSPQANGFIYAELPTYHPVDVVQYNFRLYPDCNNNYVIDSTPLMCNLGGGTNCPADMDNGSGTGSPDNGVDINDLVYFLAKFELGHLEADLDDGWGTGNPDNGVDINDLIFFLNHFVAGC